MISIGSSHLERKRGYEVGYQNKEKGTRMKKKERKKKEEEKQMQKKKLKNEKIIG